jgi:Transposase DDE domain
MIVGLVMDQDGRPLCSELWPGNTSEVTTLLPVVDRLRARFGVGRICIVADRGMISAQTIAALEHRKLEYVLGVRERSSAEVRGTVIDDQTPFVPLAVPRASGEHTELEAKQVKIGERGYIVCRNLAEARRDAEQREAILSGLRAKLAQADNALVGNSGFRRYLKTVSAEHFAIDEARVVEDARSMGSTCCAPIPRSPRCRSCCAIATYCGSSSCCAKPRPSSPPVRSTTAATSPFAAMCSALFSRSCSPRNSKIGSTGTGLPPNGATSCAISIGCRKSTSSRMASASCCVPRPPASPVGSFRRSASPYRPMFRNSPSPRRSHPPNPGAKPDAVVLRPPHPPVRL